MSLKNVVKVMNFHSLLRVDRSRKAARKYSQMEEMVLEMLDNILNNRNVILDVKALQMDPKMPKLLILLGSDLGFCGNLNNLVRRNFLEKAQENYLQTLADLNRLFEVHFHTRTAQSHTGALLKRLGNKSYHSGLDSTIPS